jgi:hypothetical protein
MALKLLGWIINRTDTARRSLMGWNKTIQFMLDGEEPFFLKTADSRLTLFKGKAESPDLVFKSNSGDFFNVMIGKTKFDQGFSRGEYTIVGSIIDAVKLMRTAEFATDSHPMLMGVMRAVSRVTG